MKLLVVGGGGYIGSHINRMLQLAGYDTVVFDNFVRGSQENIIHGPFIRGDLSNISLLDELLSNFSFDAVLHFAALTDVGESMQNPLKYYQNNVIGTLNLIDAMLRHSVSVLIFSSTAAVYGIPEILPVQESHPCQPINPYGQTKLIIEQLLQSLPNLKSCSLRYFNAAGGDPRGEIKYQMRAESNIIPKVLNSISEPITIYGTDYPTADGTCIRDYVHIEDLGRAHIKAMERLFEGGPSGIYNLGSGEGFSVRQLLDSIEKVVEKKLKIVEGPRRIGDPPILVADYHKARQELNWQPNYSLDEMILHAWQARK